MGYVKIARDTFEVWAGLLRKSKKFSLHYGVSQLLALTMDSVYTLVVARAFQRIADRAAAGGAGLGKLVGFYLLAVAATVILWGFGDNYISNRLQDKLQIHFRGEMLHRMLAAPLYGGREIPAGDFAKRYAVDTKTAAQFLVRRISGTLLSPLLGGLASLWMLWALHPVLAATALGVGVLTFLLQKLPLPHAAQAAKDQAAAEGDYSAQLHDAAENLSVLRMFGAVPFLGRRMDGASEAVWRTGKRLLGIDVFQKTLILGIPFLQTLAVLAAGGILAGQGALSLGGLLAAVAYGETVCYLFDGVSRGLASVQGGRAAGERVLEILTLPPQRQKPLGHCPAPYALIARGVGLELDGHRVLADGNLALKMGEKAAITGVSGSGKSTLARLLCGAYEDYCGELALAAGQIHYVPSGCRLLNGTLGENISSFAECPDEKRIRELIGLMKLEGMDADFPIEVHGENLSGGQRQRIAIARALYACPELAIFDEPTAALDAGTGSEVMAAILSWLREKTVTVITHDRQVAQQMDRRYVVRDGRVEVGLE